PFPTGRTGRSVLVNLMLFISAVTAVLSETGVLPNISLTLPLQYLAASGIAMGSTLFVGWMIPAVFKACRCFGFSQKEKSVGLASPASKRSTAQINSQLGGAAEIELSRIPNNQVRQVDGLLQSARTSWLGDNFSGQNETYNFQDDSSISSLDLGSPR
ncbi:unnamed protein product, partial [marine sediment metagenome]